MYDTRGYSKVAVRDAFPLSRTGAIFWDTKVRLVQYNLASVCYCDKQIIHLLQ